MDPFSRLVFRRVGNPPGADPAKDRTAARAWCKDPLMDTLTDGQIRALENLGREQAGEPAPWINISDARALTELGLAERTREGWKITDEGTGVLALRKSATPDAPEPLSPPTQLFAPRG